MTVSVPITFSLEIAMAVAKAVEKHLAGVAPELVYTAAEVAYNAAVEAAMGLEQS